MVFNVFFWIGSRETQSELDASGPSPQDHNLAEGPHLTSGPVAKVLGVRPTEIGIFMTRMESKELAGQVSIGRNW
jgi:hypothetical protein